MLDKKWKLDLAGEWELELPDESSIPGMLPGCTYLALLEQKRIPDPFWGCNEQAAAKLAEQDYRYKKKFSLKKEEVLQGRIELVADGVDTLAQISVNGTLAGKTENTFRVYRFDVKNLLWEGENEIEILFEAPHERMRQQQEKRPLAGMDIGVPGISYIRKPQYHFGWDWGPCLPPAGISGTIALEGYSCGKLESVTFTQKHELGRVFLTVYTNCDVWEKKTLMLDLLVTAPNGSRIGQRTAVTDNRVENTICIQNPELWWCNGMGEQPLYAVDVTLQTEAGETLDAWNGKIGLRTIELNMDADRWGENFQFRINGEPVFAKGANWIPADSFIERVTEDKLEFYISSAKAANMNMLRVWGGGYYETDRFYELCDRYGILIWQDFAFACRAYPLDDPRFVENVRAEIRNQVLRLHHHASLALWCGNNELQLEELLWAKDKVLRKTIHVFFFETLPKWIRETDSTTPYWYGSPSDRKPGKRANGLNRGDTHLWQVWHGLMSIDAFRRFPTRFCSEFGLESLPSRNAIASFTDVENSDLQSAEIQNHQKSARGNEKLLYYITMRYHRPVDMESTIYLSQIMQAEGIRSAVDYWHRNKGRCNGALYWQYNDCWPVVSWSGIDYLGQYKALQYFAKSFYAPVGLVSEQEKGRVQVWVINDRNISWSGSLRWHSVCLDGTQLAAGSMDIAVGKCSVLEPIIFACRDITKGKHLEEVVLCLALYDGEKEIVRRNQLLEKEQRIRFPKPAIATQLTMEQTRGELILETDCFTHYVELSVEGIALNFSDNFFDLEKGEQKVIQFELPEKIEEAEFLRRLKIRSYADFLLDDTSIKDTWMRICMRWSLKGIKGRLMTRI